MIDPAAPFALGNGTDACLLLHGLTGAPSEVRPVGEALAKAGVRAVGPLLPGHGTRPEDLQKLSRADLLGAARAALGELSGARRLFVCGLSVGALLALRLAADDRARIEAIALLAPAIEFAGTTWFFTQVVGRLPFVPRLCVSKGARDIQAPQPPGGAGSAAMHADGAYRAVPLSWGREMRKLAAESIAVAGQVGARTLIAHGALDRTAHPRGARLLAAKLGAREVTVQLYPRSGHVLPCDLEGAAVSDAVVKFFMQSEG